MSQLYTFRWAVYSDGGGGGDAAAAESLVRGPQYWDRRGWDQDQGRISQNFHFYTEVNSFL